MDAPPPSPGTRPPEWVERNWKWFVPLLLLIITACLAVFLAIIFQFMKSSDAYVGAVARARSAPEVVAAIGTPMKEGFLVTGHINLSGGSGRADLAIPLEGPKGSATVYVAATKSLGQWHYEGLVVHVDKTGERIDLSERPSAPEPATSPHP